MIDRTYIYILDESCVPKVVTLQPPQLIQWLQPG